MKSRVDGVVGRGIRAQLRPLWPWEDEDTSPPWSSFWGDCYSSYILGRPPLLPFGETTFSFGGLRPRAPLVFLPSGETTNPPWSHFCGETTFSSPFLGWRPPGVRAHLWKLGFDKIKHISAGFVKTEDLSCLYCLCLKCCGTVRSLYRDMRTTENCSLNSFTPGNGEGGLVTVNSLWQSATDWSESIFEDFRLYWITAVQPPLAAHGCQCHLKEASIGRIGMTSWKRSFLSTRTLNPSHLANINSQARVSWSYDMQVILRHTVDQNSELSFAYGLHCSKIGGKQGNILYVTFLLKNILFSFLQYVDPHFYSELVSDT